jgi:hypothetical protein
MPRKSTATIELIHPATNDGAATIEMSEPYAVKVRVEGAAALLFHRWSVDSIKTKAGAAKGSAAKKTDDVDSYIFRDEAGHICIPGEYIRQSIIGAAKFRQDPRSPRKSAQDLYKAGLVCLTELAPIFSVLKPDEYAKTWDFLDTRRVTVQRAGVNRVRPCFKAGWSAEFVFSVILPEYISRSDFQQTVESAGRLIGLADFRPTFGRFGIVHFE